MGHLDHVGVDPTEEGEDKIFNGAMDNATGIATMLEVARAMVESGERPRRSILFAAVTGAQEAAVFDPVYSPPRLPSGKPDLQGLWWNALVTRLSASRSSTNVLGSYSQRTP